MYIISSHCTYAYVTCEAGNAHSSRAPGSKILYKDYQLYWVFTGLAYFTHIICSTFFDKIIDSGFVRWYFYHHRVKSGELKASTIVL